MIRFTGTLFFCLMTTLLFASSSWGFHYGDRVHPATGYIEFSIGIQERDIHLKSDELANCCKVEGVAVSTRVMTRVGLRPIPRLEIFGLVGGVSLGIEEFGGFDSKFEVAYGGGGRILLYKTSYPQSSGLFLEYQYLQFSAQDRVEIEKGDPVVVTLQDQRIEWEEHLVKIGGEYRYGPYRSYGGFRVSFLRGESLFSLVSPPSNEIGPAIIEEDDTIGVFAGVDIFLDARELLVLNLEMSLFDVNAFRVGMVFAF